MKIALAQIHSIPFDVEANLDKHLAFIKRAIEAECDAIFFPELSVTSYAEQLSEEYFFDFKDHRLEEVYKLCRDYEIVVGLGLPTISSRGKHISMLIYQAPQPPVIYSKQELHADELAHYVGGTGQALIQVGRQVIAPAICYESTIESHLKQAIQLGAQFYVCPVAKSAAGMQRTSNHYSEMSSKYSIPILVVNGVGQAQDFEYGGHTAYWNTKGELETRLGSEEEDLLVVSI